MTERSTLSDDQIRRLLEHRADRADATGLLEAISAEIAGAPQRSAGLHTRAIGWAGVAAAAVIVLAAGALALRGPSAPAGSQIASSPFSSASAPGTIPSLEPSAQPLAPAGLDAPPLGAGTWSTLAFQPGVTFTVPADRWSPGLDLPQQLFLRAHLPTAPADEVNATTIVRLEDVYTDPCGLGSSGGTRPWTEGADAFLPWLQQHSPLAFGPRSSQAVLGRPAQQIELELPEGAYATCADGYLPIGTTGSGPSGEIAIPRNGQRFRLAAVDVEGKTLLVLTFGSPGRWDALVAATDQVLATVRFQ